MPSREWPARRRRTTPRPPEGLFRCSPWASDHRDGRASCCRRSSSTASSPDRCFRETSPNWSGDCSPACSSATPSCWYSTCRWPRSGRSCCRSRGRISTRASSSSPARRVRGRRSPVDLLVLLVVGLIGFADAPVRNAVVPAVIGVILGSRAEEEMRRALQISDGEISGLFNTAFSIAIYTIIALVLLWPLVNRFVIRRFRPPAHEVHVGHSHALVELAEEIAEEPAEPNRPGPPAHPMRQIRPKGRHDHRRGLRTHCRRPGRARPGPGGNAAAESAPRGGQLLTRRLSGRQWIRDGGRDRRDSQPARISRSCVESAAQFAGGKRPTKSSRPRRKSMRH